MRKESIIGSALSQIGVEGVRTTGRVTSESFPAICKDDFQDLFTQFIFTRLGESVASVGSTAPEKTLATCFAFMSYTSNYTSSLYSSTFNLQKTSASILLSCLKNDVALVQDKIKRYNLSKEFTLYHVDVNLKPKSYSRDLNIQYDFDAEIQLRFRLSKRRKVVRDKHYGMHYKENSIVAAFHRIKPYMFKRDIPKQLLPKTNFKLERYPLENDVLRLQTSRFAELERGVHAHVTGKDSFVIRMKATQLRGLILAYGRESKETLLPRVEKAAAKLFIGVK